MVKMTLNNFKIRTKLLLIYFFCVLMPLIFTDGIILYSIQRNARQDQLTALKDAMKRLEYNLDEIVNGSILFTHNLYTDQLLNDFLNHQYSSSLDYYYNYTMMQRNNSLSYNYNYGILTKIEIFADNDTLLSGGKISSLNKVKNSQWYQSFMKSGEDVFLYTYYDEMKKKIPGSGSSRTISIIRKLDHFGYNGIEKILKIDIDYNVMLQDVLNEKIDGQIYVRNKDYILFSNLPKDNSVKEYMSARVLDEIKPTISRIFQIGRQDWEIVIVTKEKPFWSIIFENKEVIILILLNIALPTLLIYLVGKSISKRLSMVAAYIGKVEQEQFEVISCQEGDDEIGKLIRNYNMMVLRIKDLIEVVFKGNAEKQALELSKKQAELKAIQSQVNPHFLYNTLETIRMRSLIKNEDETADIIGELAVLFRKSMNWGSDFVTLNEEMSFIEKYIKIQKYRFGDKIKYYHYVMEECKNYYIPKLSIATFVENACIHGIEAMSTEGVISITITQNSEFLNIEISDNGKGFEDQELEQLRWSFEHADNKLLNESKSTGMLNAFLRLKMFCEGKLSFEVDSSINNGTDITIQLPLQYVITNMDQKDGKEDITND